MLVIPAIDLIDGQCVRLLRGDYGRQATYQQDPVEQALRFQELGFQRLHLIDLQGAKSGHGENRRTIQRIIEAVEIPVQIGGGIRSNQDVDQLLKYGASFLILGTVAIENPEQVDKWVRARDASRFIVSLDLRQGKLLSRGWLRQSSLHLEEVIDRCIAWGIREMICTDVEKDGTLEQPGYSTLQNLLELLPSSISLIAAGGVSTPPQVSQLKKLGLGGAIVGRALYEGAASAEDFVHAG